MRAINRIGLQLYRNNILKSLGMQFCTLLTDYYAQIPYTEEGLSRIFMDIAKFKPLIGMFCCDDVDHRFKVLRTLIDIYVIKNDEKAIMSYVTTEK